MDRFYSFAPERRGFLALVVGMALAVLLADVGSVRAQPEGAPPWEYVEVYTEQALDFGTAAQNEGAVAVHLTDPLIGKFEVRARLRPNQEITVTLEVPGGMVKGSEEVPFELNAAYNTHQDDPVTAAEFSGPTVSFRPAANPSYADPPAAHPDASAYVYVYGTASVGYQPTGTYTGPVTLEATITKK